MRRDTDHVNALIEQQVQIYMNRTPESKLRTMRAVNSLPLGVPTNVCALSPYPVVVERGDGCRLYDVDKNEYFDFHAGFGTTVTGHNHPKVTEAIKKQAERGVHFGSMTTEVLPWAEHICDRFGLDWIRFSNSGTEATMDALRLARAKTGRHRIAKIEGGYHGSHESALVSGNFTLDGSEGPDDAPVARPMSKGLPPRLLEDVIVLPFNNPEAARNLLSNHDVAAVIVEPIMFNVGAIFPVSDYLALLRDICTETGTLLIFDETKTCITIAYAGAEEYFDVKPDIKTLGKGIGGGLAVGAFGGTDDSCFKLIESFEVPHLGTFCGNPLTAAAGHAALVEVMHRESYRNLEVLNSRLVDGIQEIIEEYELPAYVVGAGAKGCVVWARPPHLVDFRDYRRRFDFDLVTLCWLFMMNHGIFLSPGGDEQWTIGVAHDRASIDAYIEVFRQFAEYLDADS